MTSDCGWRLRLRVATSYVSMDERDLDINQKGLPFQAYFYTFLFIVLSKPPKGLLQIPCLLWSSAYLERLLRSALSFIGIHIWCRAGHNTLCRSPASRNGWVSITLLPNMAVLIGYPEAHLGLCGMSLAYATTTLASWAYPRAIQLRERSANATTCRN